ncbi:MAG: hypothetical protein ACK40M_10350 [Flavobacteriales bacterium]
MQTSTNRHSLIATNLQVGQDYFVAIQRILPANCTVEECIDTNRNLRFMVPREYSDCISSL